MSDLRDRIFVALGDAQIGGLTIEGAADIIAGLAAARIDAAVQAEREAAKRQLAEAVELLKEIVPEYRQLIEECGHDPSVGIDCSADFDRALRHERARAFLAKQGGGA